MHQSDSELGGAQYNFFLHSLPHYGDSDVQDAQVPRAQGSAGAAEASYHWHIEITPRTSIPTGFELGSGLFVNTVAPEAAAEKLRAVILD